MPQSVYRCYGDPDETELLYVGRTSRGEERLAEHARTKDWWDEVDHCTVTDTEAHAVGHVARLEKKAIQSEHPSRNIIHNR